MKAREEQKWREPTLYSVENHDSDEMSHDDPDDAIEMYLDGIKPDEWPETLKVHGCAPVHLSNREHDAELLLEQTLENLDEEHLCNEPTRPTPAMRAAALAYWNVIRREYKPWACEEVGEPLVVNVAEWVAEKMPEWLAPAEPPGEEPAC